MRRKAEPCFDLLLYYLRHNHRSSFQSFRFRSLSHFSTFQPSHQENCEADRSQHYSPKQGKSSSSKLGSFVHLHGPYFPAASSSKRCVSLGLVSLDGLLRRNFHRYSYHRNFFTRAKQVKKIEISDQHSQRAVTTALWCNFLVFSLKFGVWLVTSSHVMLAEVVHSLADFANQALLAYGLSSSRRAPDALHPYGYSKERFVWSLISAVGIFCLGSGGTIVHGIQNLWTVQPPENILYAALVLGGSFLIEGASLLVAIQAVKKGAAAEGTTVRDYVWRGHDPTSVAVMAEVAIFLVQRNRHALIGRAMDDHDVEKVLHFLKNDLVVDAVYDCKSEVIGPGFFRFKAEIVS